MSAATQSCDGEDGCVVALTMPQGAKPGDVLTVEHGGKTLEAIIPPNAQPGDIVQIQIVDGDGDGHGGEDGTGAFHESEYLVIAIPPGVSPGDALAIEHEGREVEFIVPANAKPGDEIEVRPEELLDRGCDQVVEGPAGELESTNKVSSGDSSLDATVETPGAGPVLGEGAERIDEGVTIVITVPPGVSAGDVLTLEHEGKEVQFVVPAGLSPGDEIEVRPEELGGARNDVCSKVEDLAIGEGDDDKVNSGPTSNDDGVGPNPQAGTIELVIPEGRVPGVDSLTFTAPDGRQFALPIPEGCSAGDVLTVQLPGIAGTDGKSEGAKDDNATSDSAVVDVSETVEETEDAVIRTTVEEKEDGTITRTIETTTTLSDGSNKVETETIVEKPRKHKSLREKRAHMLEFRRKAEAEEAERRQREAALASPQKPKPKPTSGPVDEETARMMLADADAFYTAGEVRAGGRYTYNQGLLAEGSAEMGEANPLMPDVKPTLAAEWYKEEINVKEEIDVEESRKGTMSRSAAITQFEEDRAAVFDEDGNERPTPQLVIALEAASIVMTRKAEGLNVRLDALVAADEQRVRSRVLEPPKK